MKNTFGNSLTVTLFGESHGEYIGAVLDGIAPGIEIDTDFIQTKLSFRRPQGNISTSRAEADRFVIASGVFEGKTTGTPLTILIPNENTKPKDYSYGVARPSHADYTAYVKYGGNEDYRGGGHFSARVTAGLVAVGAIAISVLESKGIRIATHIQRCAGVSDRDFENYTTDFDKLNSTYFAVLNDSAGEQMMQNILSAKAEGDSVGGVLETVVTGMPKGVGEPWFDSVESMLSHAMFSIPAVKGIEFGDGFKMCDMKGSEANDQMYIEGGEIRTYTNSNGGINGGITNGMPIVMRLAIKPTPTIFKQQKTVDFIKGENTVTNQHGRHDPCVVHRARAVADSVTALTLCDLLVTRYGTDFLGGKK